MKRILVLLLVATLFIACKKDVTNNDNGQTGITDSSDINKIDNNVITFDFSKKEIYFDEYIDKQVIEHNVYKNLYIYSDVIVAIKDSSGWIKGVSLYRKAMDDILQKINSENVLFETDIESTKTKWESVFFRGIYHNCIIVSSRAFSNIENIQIFNYANDEMIVESEHDSDLISMKNESELSLFLVTEATMDDSKLVNGVGERTIIYTLDESILNFSTKVLSKTGNSTQSEEVVLLQDVIQ
jgi:hypothetical protein